MTQQYRLLVRDEVLQQLTELRRAAATQPGGLREREHKALALGLQALAQGQEANFAGKRLGITAYDLSDCAEVKLSVIPESRGDRDLGPSHRLVYREFEAEDGGLPYRQVIAFEPRKNDRPFKTAATRLGRDRGTRLNEFRPVTYTPPTAPPRLALPDDLRTALAATSGVAPPSGTPRPQRPRPGYHLPSDSIPREL
jgi:hypothetical protein